MAAVSGGRFWLLVIGVGAFLPAASLCNEDYKICNISCCKVLPNCEEAYYVDCICQDDSLTSLEKDDIPKSVGSIRISTRSSLTIYRKAVFDLKSLVELILYDMNTLKVHEDGLKLNRGNRLFTFDVDHVRHVEILSRAFTGHWNGETTIRMRAVHQLEVHGDAFSFTSVEHSSGPTLMLKHIDVLNMHSGALSARLTHLSLSHARMQSCEMDSFGPNIRQIDMRNITIGNVQEGCIKGAKMLSIRLSTINVIEARGFAGRIDEVTLDENNITEIQENGILLQTRRFELNFSKIRELKSNSLSAVAEDQILFNDVDVIFLRRHALFGLRIQQADPTITSMIIRNLRISHAENGSLAFANGTKLTLYNLQVNFPRICPAKLWAHQLTGVSEGNSFTQDQQQVFHQLRSKIQCHSSDLRPLPPTRDKNLQPARGENRRPTVDNDDVSFINREDSKDIDGSDAHEDETNSKDDHPPVTSDIKLPGLGSTLTALYVTISIAAVLLLVASGLLAYKTLQPRLSSHQTWRVISDVPEENGGDQVVNMPCDLEDRTLLGQSAGQEFHSPVADTPSRTCRKRRRKRSASAPTGAQKNLQQQPSQPKED